MIDFFNFDKKSSRPSYQGQDLVLGKSLSLFFRVGVRVKSINHKEKKGIGKNIPHISN